MSEHICSCSVICKRIWMHCCCTQNPREADAMTKIQNDLDETKIVLVINLSAVLFIFVWLSQYRSKKIRSLEII